ncbi:MAG: type IX secretion system sortase PorU, partial [bacterium]
MKKYPLFLAFLCIVFITRGQRNYTASSLLSAGFWVKISTEAPGIYQINAKFLREAGFSSRLPSQSIKLFGNGGAIIPVSNSGVFQDDIVENAIHVNDGGDGFFDGEDYLLFYAPGADRWEYDSLKKTFSFKKNIYSTKAYYFITAAAGNGKRVLNGTAISGATGIIKTSDEHYRHELDSINFLKSGQEWYGEEFAASQGSTVARDFRIPLSGLLSGSNYFFRSAVIGQSAAQPNTFTISVNGKKLTDQFTSPLSGSNFDPVANTSEISTIGLLDESTMNIRFSFSGGSINAKGWLNWFEIIAQRSLDLVNKAQLQFRNIESVRQANIARFELSNATSSTRVWEVTDPSNPALMPAALAGTTLSFVADCSRLKEYIGFSPDAAMLPKVEGVVANQDLHATGYFDMAIVTNKQLIAEARRLAQHHQQKDGLRIFVVDIEQLYNEFSSGSPDPSAIRNFLKMAYDRAGMDVQQRPKFLLLFGPYSYKFRDISATQFIPSYQSESSLDPLSSYVTDDYFGYLDDEDDITKPFPYPLLDIAIGRIPARTLEQARTAVDKIIDYHSYPAFGKWRNDITLVADDEDFNLHLNDAELHAALIQELSPTLNINKIYLDAFPQESSAGGEGYPSVNRAIANQINKGTLVWNYSGHGSSSRLAQETILDKDIVAGWKNAERLPLFITATCDFAPFDDQDQFSLGEDLFIGRRNGAIGLVTTTRQVFASSNRVINNNFFSTLFKTDANRNYPRLGSALQDAKNYTIVNVGDVVNSRKFVLLGDPAMKLSMPEYTIAASTVNGKPITTVVDTLRSQNQYTITGEVHAPSGELAADFNGYIYPTVYDKPASIKTLGNDTQSKVVEFSSDLNIIYDGKVKAENGKFSFTFVVPKDIKYQYGKGRISFYGENGRYDAAGVEERLVVGGLGDEVINDHDGPVIKAYLNDTTFKNGDVVAETPLLIAQFADASGINLTRTGIGHDITAVIDGDKRNALVLNEYFQPTLSGQLKGVVRFPLPTLADGKHTIVIKAWDVLNNSGEYTIECEVRKQKEIFITRLINYPNPFSGNTRFLFDLDGPYLGATAHIDIFTMTGQLLKRLSKTINESDDRSIEIEWNGSEESGDAIGRGVYIFQ